MYIPKHFSVDETEKIWSFIEANSFGQVISSHEDKLFSTHMPFMADKERSKFTGHFARQNPQWTDIDGQEVLIILQGAHDYISPSWYEGSVVPTWNYQTVHIYGVARTFEEEDDLQQLVEQLTAIYEAGETKPWRQQSRLKLNGAVVGVEIEITDIQCKFKLSQNRSKDSRRQIAEALEQRGSSQLAQSIRELDESVD